MRTSVFNDEFHGLSMLPFFFKPHIKDMIGVQTVPHRLCLTLGLAGGTVVEGCGTFWTWV